ncbi:unnamed protein product, partial [Didymodactylos carnosus]
LVQHDQIKEEILHQNLLQLIIDCSLKLVGPAKQSSLETLWAMTFNEAGAEILKNNKLFLDNIKVFTTQRDDEGVRKAADGLIWKLVKEPEFIAKVEEKKETE